MTVPVIVSNERRYVEDGVFTGPFPYPVRFLAPGDLEVRRKLASDDAFSPIDGWSVTGAGSGGGGSVTLPASIAGATLSIRRRTAVQQPTEYAPYQDFPAESHELALDRGILIAQDQAEAERLFASRALLAPEDETPALLPVSGVRGSRLARYVAGDPGVLLGADGVVALGSDGAPYVLPIIDVIEQLGGTVTDEGIWSIGDPVGDEGIWS